ncbi:DUF262 domain-containing protein [Marinifilum sp.]|uniref:DUF262 domain-containing protein n=1 Tax=Marinifilum sp. TaxID=2033137 RepID=UPI003BAB6E70
MAFQPPTTIFSAIQKIDSNKLLLPAIQREFVWSHNKIEMLFDSLMRDYPIGSLLLWKVEGENKINHRYYTVLKNYRERYKTHCEEINTDILPDFEAILDGQQRLTAIYIGLKGTYAYKKPRVVWRDNEYAVPTRKLFLNIDELYSNGDDDQSDDGRLYNFRFLSQEDTNILDNGNWFPVEKILSLQGTFKLNKFLKEKGWDDNEFISETLSKLHDVVHVNPLINYYLESEQDYEKALNIFVRINSGGEVLNYSDLIMSTLIAGCKEIDARLEINNLINEIWNSYEFDIDKDLVLRTYLLLFSEDIKFRVTNFSVKNAIEFEQNWKSIRKTIVEAFQLISDFGYVERTLTSKNAVLPIIYYLYKSGKVKKFSKKVAYEEDRKVVRKWFHAVLLHRIFGGQADSVLKTIRDVILKAIKKETDLFPIKEIAKKLSKTRKSITVDDEFIEGLLWTQYEDRYAFPILALLYPNLDYRNGDFHKDHIHPKSWFRKRDLKKHGIEVTEENKEYFADSDMYNGIVNLQMLDSSQNISKSDKSLTEWAKNGADLKKQLIPEKLDFNDFPEFVDERWDMLTKKLKKELTF